MIRNGCVAVCYGIEPDLVAARSLAVKCEAARPQLPDDVLVAEPASRTFLGRDNNCIVKPAFLRLENPEGHHVRAALLTTFG